MLGNYFRCTHERLRAVKMLTPNFNAVTFVSLITLAVGFNDPAPVVFIDRNKKKISQYKTQEKIVSNRGLIHSVPINNRDFFKFDLIKQLRNNITWKKCTKLPYNSTNKKILLRKLILDNKLYKKK